MKRFKRYDILLEDKGAKLNIKGGQYVFSYMDTLQ